jgi:hypothetical protein
MKPFSELAERRERVRELFHPDGTLTASGLRTVKLFQRGFHRVLAKLGVATRPEVETLWPRKGGEGYRVKGWAVATGGVELYNLTREMDLNMPVLKNQAALQEEGWGALLEEHPRGCVLWQLYTVGGSISYFQMVLLLPHPHDRVSQENRLSVFPLGGGGWGLWDVEGLTLTPGVLTAYPDLKVGYSSVTHLVGDGDGRREALEEASLSKAASYEGLTTLAERLGLTSYPPKTDPILCWDTRPGMPERVLAKLKKVSEGVAPLLFQEIFQDTVRDFTTRDAGSRCYGMRNGRQMLAQFVTGWATSTRPHWVLYVERAVLHLEDCEWALSGEYPLEDEEDLAMFQEEFARHALHFTKLLLNIDPHLAPEPAT